MECFSPGSPPPAWAYSVWSQHQPCYSRDCSHSSQESFRHTIDKLGYISLSGVRLLSVPDVLARWGASEGAWSPVGIWKSYTDSPHWAAGCVERRLVTECLPIQVPRGAGKGAGQGSGDRARELLMSCPFPGFTLHSCKMRGWPRRRSGSSV